MSTPDQLLAVLAQHIGRGKGIKAEQLAEKLGVPERKIRTFISELRDEGNAICGTPHDGYFVAHTPEELEETCAFLRNRALHSLRLESRLRNVPLADLLGQLHVPT
jgi:biotin operon repressor